MAIVESDWSTCAFESWSLPLSEEDLELPLEAHLLVVSGTEDGSCSDANGLQSEGGDDVTVDAYLVMDLKCLETLVPPPAPHTEAGELELGVEVCFSDSTLVHNSWFQNQFAGEVLLDDGLLDQEFSALSMCTLKEVHVQGLGTTESHDVMNALSACIPDTGYSGEALVDALDTLVFDGEYAEASLDSPTELDSGLQFGEDISWDNAMLNEYFPALSMSNVDEIPVHELGTTHLDNANMDHGLCIPDTAEAGVVFVEELDSQLAGFQIGGDVSFDDTFFLQDFQALSMPSGEEIPVPRYSSTPDAMDIRCVRIGDPTAWQGDVLIEACPDAFVSDGSGEYASSSDSMSWLPFSGVRNLTDDDNVLNYQSVLAVRRWPVKEPSESIGVDERENGTWEAHIWLKDFNIDRAQKEKNGMQFFLGSFSSEEDAKRAHDKAAIMMNVRVNKYRTLYSLNYPEEEYADYIAEHADWSRRDYMWKMRRESGKFSKGACSLKGVARRKNHRKPGEEAGATYTATMSVTTTIDGVKRKTTMTIGHFESEDEAGREYDKALLFIKGVNDSGCITNFRPGCYSASEVQDAGQRLASAYPRVNFMELSRKHSEVFSAEQ